MLKQTVQFATVKKDGVVQNIGKSVLYLPKRSGVSKSDKENKRNVSGI